MQPVSALAGLNGKSPEEGGYAFKDSTGEIDENEFIRRYRGLVGPSELDELEGQRHRGKLYLGVAGIVAGVGVAVAGTLIFVSQTAEERSKQGPWAISAGGGLGLTAIVFGILSVVDSQRADTHDHRISEFDAELFVQQYNRRLLKKTVTDTDQRIRTLQGRTQWQPTLELSPFGLRGTF